MRFLYKKSPQIFRDAGQIECASQGGDRAVLFNILLENCELFHINSVYGTIQKREISTEVLGANAEIEQINCNLEMLNLLPSRYRISRIPLITFADVFHSIQQQGRPAFVLC